MQSAARTLSTTVQSRAAAPLAFLLGVMIVGQTTPAGAQAAAPGTPPPQAAPATQPVAPPASAVAPPKSDGTTKLEAAPKDTGGTPATVIDEEQIESLLGKKAESKTGEDMGQIVDVLADKSGQVRAAVIDFGGFFGVGSRKIAVDWRSLSFPADTKTDKVIVDLPLAQLRVAPVYKEGEPVVVLGPVAAIAKAPVADPAQVVAPAAASAPVLAAPQPPSAVQPPSVVQAPLGVAAPVAK